MVFCYSCLDILRFFSVGWGWIGVWENWKVIGRFCLLIKDKWLKEEIDILMEDEGIGGSIVRGEFNIYGVLI